MHGISLDSETISKIFKILEKYPEIKKVSVFGSRANGNANPYSDIDLACFDDISENTHLSLINDFFESNIPQKIDFLIFNQIDSTALIQQIQKHSKAFYIRS